MTRPAKRKERKIVVWAMVDRRGTKQNASIFECNMKSLALWLDRTEPNGSPYRVVRCEGVLRGCKA